ncbi:hypothetical protein DB346_05425 [Verrucomicrobia bacterium LW23]|nr:hypothetical protein DB346_05425 [Verrucomicrobia bacterium LW23]
MTTTSTSTAGTFHDVPRRFWPSLAHPRIAWPSRPLALVHGPTGTGKTHEVCNAVYARLRAAGGHAHYVTHAGLTTAVLRAIDSGDGKAAVVDKYQATPVLVLDEFAATAKDMADASYSTARDIIFHRTANLLPTFIVTNCTLTWLREHLDPAFYARLTCDHRDESEEIEIATPPTARGFGRPWQGDRLPDPDWMPALMTLLSDVTWNVTGEPMSIPFMGKSMAFSASYRAKMLCAGAWQWLEATKPAQLSVLQELYLLEECEFNKIFIDAASATTKRRSSCPSLMTSQTQNTQAINTILSTI